MKNHKHIWIIDIIDCPSCGLGEIQRCEVCDEEREVPRNGVQRKVKKN